MNRREALIETFLDLAKIEGLSGDEGRIAARIKERLHGLGFEVVEEPPVTGGRQGNLLVRVGGGGETLLSSHLDTARSTADLRPSVRPDRIVSDGTTVLGVDNRLGVSLLVHTLERVARERLSVAPFTCAFLVREETDLAGSRTLAIDPRWREAFILDSSLRPGHFIHRAPGAQSFRLEIHGRSAHAGIAPEKGIDAIRVLAGIIDSFDLGRVDSETTANVGVIRGGSAINTVADRAIAEGEVRSMRRTAVADLIARFADIAEERTRLAGARHAFVANWDFEPFELPLDHAVCGRALSALRRIGLEPKPTASGGGSDANSYNARGLPAVNFGIGAQNPHADDEFVLLEDMEKGADLALALVASVE